MSEKLLDINECHSIVFKTAAESGFKIVCTKEISSAGIERSSWLLNIEAAKPSMAQQPVPAVNELTKMSLISTIDGYNHVVAVQNFSSSEKNGAIRSKEQFVYEWWQWHDAFPPGLEYVKELLESFNAILEKVDAFQNKVDVPEAFNVHNKEVLNRIILPYFIMNDEPEFCSQILRFNLSPYSPLVYALRDERISVNEVKQYKNVPDEWLEQYFQVS